MKYFFGILFLIISLQTFSQDKPINVLFVIDGSSSMLKKWGHDDKWTIAERSLLRISDSLLTEFPNINMGLRVYGHQSLPVDKNCKDTELKLPIKHNTTLDFKNKLIGVKPKGITPLAYTLEQTELDFEGLDQQKNILILITDGSESCEGDPCAILDILLKREVIVKPVIIGLDIDIESLKAYDCIEKVFNPHTAEEFEKNIIKAVHQAIKYTTVQVFLKDGKNLYNQSNVPMFFYSNNKLDYTFYHKMDNKGLPDTLFMSPDVDYHLEIQTIPKVVLENIHLQANVHNKIYVDVPTCNLSINTYLSAEKTSLIPEIPYFIKISNEENYLYSSYTNTPQNYLFGNYDIDVLTTPITQFKNVSLKELNKEIKIAAPGTLKLSSRYPLHGAIFKEINNTLVNIYNFKNNSTSEVVDLQPGNYDVVYRFNHKRKMIESEQISIVIQSKKITEIKL